MSDARLARQAATRAPTSAIARRALIVAPDDAVRDRLTRLLGGWGIQVTTSAHPLEAVVLLHQGWAQALAFDLVLFSPQGHQVDPGAFASLILSDPRAARIALMHIGEVQNVGDRGRLRKAGFHDFLDEASDTRVVYETVQWALVGHASRPSDDGKVVPIRDRQIRMRPGRRRLEILIADPDAAHRRIAIQALADSQCRLAEAANGEAVLAAVSARIFDIVILALDCGDYHACELMGIMRFTMAPDHCPVFIGVGAASPVDEGDFAAVVDLPLRGHALVRAVEAVVHIDAEAPSEPSTPAPIPRLDQRALAALHRINPSPEFLPRVIREFLGQVEANLQHLSHCFGGPMCHRKLLDFGHDLADMAGHLGALELHQLGLIAARYPEQLFDSQGHQLIGHIETSFARTREEFLPYLVEQDTGVC